MNPHGVSNKESSLYMMEKLDSPIGAQIIKPSTNLYSVRIYFMTFYIHLIIGGKLQPQNPERQRKQWTEEQHRSVS